MLQFVFAQQKKNVSYHLHASHYHLILTRKQQQRLLLERELMCMWHRTSRRTPDAPPGVSGAAAETTTAGTPVRDEGSTRQTDSAPMDGTGGSSTLQPPPPTVAPEEDAEIATRRSRSMLFLDPGHDRFGRQAELNRLRRHRVVEDVPKGQEEVHVQGCAEAGL